jgi:hypothetical protein
MTAQRSPETGLADFTPTAELLLSTHAMPAMIDKHAPLWKGI